MDQVLAEALIDAPGRRPGSRRSVTSASSASTRGGAARAKEERRCAPDRHERRPGPVSRRKGVPRRGRGRSRPTGRLRPAGTTARRPMEYKDYYAGPGRPQDGDPGRDQEGLPAPGTRAPSGPQSGRRRRRAPLQGGQRGAGRPHRPREAEALRRAGRQLAGLRAGRLRRRRHRLGRLRRCAGRHALGVPARQPGGPGGGFSDFFRTFFGSMGGGASPGSGPAASSRSLTSATWAARAGRDGARVHAGRSPRRPRPPPR